MMMDDDTREEVANDGVEYEDTPDGRRKFLAAYLLGAPDDLVIG